jgi:hypothetical protein
MEMNDAIRSMARQRFGYGVWEAPYWFIGPEEGMAPNEKDLGGRVEAWCHFNKQDLDDCRKFHLYIKEQRWHGEDAILSPTWGKLLLALMAFLGRATDRDSRVDYQRDQWGCQPGETCVIELSGLAAHDLKVERDRESFRSERIQKIKGKISSCRPRFVVMYGKDKNSLRAWDQILNGGSRVAQDGFTFAELHRKGSTVYGLAPAPTSFGQKNDNWISLGARLRAASESGT